MPEYPCIATEPPGRFFQVSRVVTVELRGLSLNVDIHRLLCTAETTPYELYTLKQS